MIDHIIDIDYKVYIAYTGYGIGPDWKRDHVRHSPAYT